MRERGQVTVLALGLVILTFAVSGLAVDGTRAFLLRRTLQNAADAASLAGTGELNARIYYGTGGKSLLLDPEASRRTALDLLRSRGIEADARIEATTASVVVTLRSEAATMFLRLAGVDSITVSARSRSAPVPGRPDP